MAQTFLSSAQVDELVGLYREGLTVKALGERFGVHQHTVRAHLVRRSVPLRYRGLAPEHTAEAVRLYEEGLTLMEVGRKFGVSQDAVRRVLAAAGDPSTWPPRVAITEPPTDGVILKRPINRLPLSRGDEVQGTFPNQRAEPAWDDVGN